MELTESRAGARVSVAHLERWTSGMKLALPLLFGFLLGLVPVVRFLTPSWRSQPPGSLFRYTIRPTWCLGSSLDDTLAYMAVGFIATFITWSALGFAIADLFSYRQMSSHWRLYACAFIFIALWSFGMWRLGNG